MTFSPESRVTAKKVPNPPFPCCLYRFFLRASVFSGSPFLEDVGVVLLDGVIFISPPLRGSIHFTLSLNAISLPELY